MLSSSRTGTAKNVQSSNKIKAHVHRIEERGSNPPGKARFSRITQNISNESSTTSPEAMSDFDICQQMLCDGYVQSYVDFYHLTHRSDPAELSRTDIIMVRNSLVRAEDSRRKGNTKGVHQSYMKLATLYSKFKDWKTAIFFYEKCFEIAQLTSDKVAEMVANHSLGVIYQNMRDINTARMFHERHEILAKSTENQEEIAKANTELYKVYFILGQEMDEADMTDDAIDMYSKCLAASKLSMDKVAEAQSNGKIGNLLFRRGEMATAIPFLRQYSQISSDLEDSENRCHASSALAAALDALGMTDKALIELQLVSSISERAGDTMLQSQACLALGKLASKIGKFDEAHDALQRHFDLLKAISSRAAVVGIKDGSSSKEHTIGNKELDTARVYLGISRGNRLLRSYVAAIDYDMSALLEWKLTRNDLLPKTNESSLT